MVKWATVIQGGDTTLQIRYVFLGERVLVMLVRFLDRSDSKGMKQYDGREYFLEESVLGSSYDFSALRLDGRRSDEGKDGNDILNR